MALFRDDTDYTHRQVGFARYKQLMSFYAFHWLKINLLTTLGALPLAAGIVFAIMASSLVVLLPASFLGGMVFGPFLAGLVDAILRGLRDAPGNWWKNYRKSWKQNWKGSLLPGGLLGLFAGLYAFIAYIMACAVSVPSAGTVLLLLLSAAMVLWFNTLYWPQLVLFRQSVVNRVRNALLFTIKHSLPVLGAVLILLAWIGLMILLAPWTLTLVPFLGFWFPIFLALLCVYGHLNRALDIEAQFIAIEGDPWRKDSFEDAAQAAPDAPPDPLNDGARHWEALMRDIEQNREDRS